MDTLHDRLAELADDAPTGGAPAAELWARGKRAHRLRAAALAATLLVVGAVGTGIGVRLADGDGNRSGPAPAGTVGIALPIEYPVGEELPDLGDTPGPLAAIWLAPRVGGGAPEAVGLVAETGTFGTLPIDVSDNREEDPDVGVPRAVARRPQDRLSAVPEGELIVRDLVSGENYSPVSEFETRAGYTWVDATHLVGHVAGGTDGDGWVWEPGTAPKLVDLGTYAGTPYLGPYGGNGPVVLDQGGGPRSCPERRDPQGPEGGRPEHSRCRCCATSWASSPVPRSCLVIGIPIACLVTGTTRTTATGQWSPWTSTAPTLRSKTRPCVAWSSPQERLSGSRSLPI